MRVLRGSKNQPSRLSDSRYNRQASAFRRFHHYIDDMPEDGLQIERAADRFADAVQDIDFACLFTQRLFQLSLFASAPEGSTAPAVCR